MARSPVNNPNAFPAEVARYLCLEPKDVDRLIALDGMPVLRIPKVKRTVNRIPLRPFHQWLSERYRAKEMVHFANYETFLSDFNAVARAS